jgi:hypothetical protein
MVDRTRKKVYIKARFNEDAFDIASVFIKHGIPFSCCGTYFDIKPVDANQAKKLLMKEIAPEAYVMDKVPANGD